MEETIFLKHCFEQLIPKAGTCITYISLGVPNLMKILFFKNVVTLLPSLLGEQLFPPNSILNYKNWTHRKLFPH